MAKSIYINDNEEIEKLLREIREQIERKKCYGTVEIKRDFSKDSRKATIFFTPDAWNKMNALVREFDTEVQWHGLIDRVSDNEFEIYDILVPPHVVTSATVTSDGARYTEWINELSDDVFNHLRFHGHSHVNMSCNPSGVDMKYRQDVVTQLPIPQEGSDDDSFYAFVIFNKKGEWSGEIYDLKNNALYGTSDITIDVHTDDGGHLSEFIAEAKKQAVKNEVKPATTVPTPTHYVYTFENTYYGNSKKKDEPKKKKEKYEAKFWKGESEKDYSYDHLRKYDWDDYDNPNSPFYVRGY